MLYSLQCWDEGGPVMIETGIKFANQEDAMVAALELACNHQGVELRRSGDLLAYVTQPTQSERVLSERLH